MTEAIRFLETLGSNPALARATSAAAYGNALDVLGVDGQKQQALLDRDPRALNLLLGGRAVMAMAIATPDNGEEQQEAPERREDEQAEPEFPRERDRPD